MKEDAQERTWKYYTADCIGALLNALRGTDSRFDGVPLFSEIGKQKHEPTGKEIQDYVLAKLTK